MRKTTFAVGAGRLLLHLFSSACFSSHGPGSLAGRFTAKPWPVSATNGSLRSSEDGPCQRCCWQCSGCCTCAAAVQKPTGSATPPDCYVPRAKRLNAACARLTKKLRWHANFWRKTRANWKPSGGNRRASWSRLPSNSPPHWQIATRKQKRLSL